MPRDFDKPPEPKYAIFVTPRPQLYSLLNLPNLQDPGVFVGPQYPLHPQCTLLQQHSSPQTPHPDSPQASAPRHSANRPILTRHRIQQTVQPPRLPQRHPTPTPSPPATKPTTPTSFPYPPSPYPTLNPSRPLSASHKPCRNQAVRTGDAHPTPPHPPWPLSSSPTPTGSGASFLRSCPRITAWFSVL